MDESLQYPQFEQDVGKFINRFSECVPEGSWLSRNMSLLEADISKKNSELQYYLIELIQLDYYIHNYQSDELLSQKLSSVEIDNYKKMDIPYLTMQMEQQMEVIGEKQEELRTLYESVQITVDIASSIDFDEASEEFQTEELEYYQKILEKCAKEFCFDINYRILETRSSEDGTFYQTFVFYISPLANNE